MVTVEFSAEKMTKNTIRFKESENDLIQFAEEGAEVVPLIIGTLYVKKWALEKLAKDGKVPSKLRVTVEVIE